MHSKQVELEPLEHDRQFLGQELHMPSASRIKPDWHSRQTEGLEASQLRHRWSWHLKHSPLTGVAEKGFLQVKQ